MLVNYRVLISYDLHCFGKEFYDLFVLIVCILEIREVIIRGCNWNKCFWYMSIFWVWSIFGVPHKFMYSLFLLGFTSKNNGWKKKTLQVITSAKRCSTYIKFIIHTKNCYLIKSFQAHTYSVQHLYNIKSIKNIVSILRATADIQFPVGKLSNN